MSLDSICQTVIVTLGVVNAWLMSRPEKNIRRYGYILGLAAEPAWFYTTITHRQFGMTVLTTWYTLTVIQGIYLHWFKEGR